MEQIYPSGFFDGDRYEVDPFRQPFVARLTSSSLIAGTYFYTWIEQSFDAITGAYVDADSAKQGTNSAIELNNALVPIPSYAMLNLRGYVNGDIEYEFAAGGTGASTITVTSPITLTVSGTTDTIGVLDATATNSGVVNTTTQTFAGDKTFQGNVLGEQTVWAGYTGVSTTTGSPGTIKIGQDTFALGQLADLNAVPTSASQASLSIQCITPNLVDLLTLEIVADTQTCDLYSGATTGGSGSCQYGVWESGSHYAGASGTDNCGNVFKGGLTTTVGFLGVETINNLSGTVSLAAGTGISVTQSGQTVTVGNTGVTSLNTMVGTVSLAAGTGVTITQSGSTITVASSSGSVSITAASPILVNPSPITGTGTISHATSGVVAGTYDNATITVEADGHVTSATSASSSGAVPIWQRYKTTVTSISGTTSFVVTSPSGSTSTITATGGSQTITVATPSAGVCLTQFEGAWPTQWAGTSINNVTVSVGYSGGDNANGDGSASSTAYLSNLSNLAASPVRNRPMGGCLTPANPILCPNRTSTWTLTESFTSSSGQLQNLTAGEFDVWLLWATLP